jgi:phosphomannomutase
LSHLARSGKTLLQLKSEYPKYAMAKTKVELTPGMNVDGLLSRVATAYADRTPDTRDGVKIDWPDRWAHLRKSNTEPIIRIYTEAPTEGQAHDLAAEVHTHLLKLS